MDDIAEFVGIPYRDKGTEPGTGLDCWQLVRFFYARVFGITLPDYMTLYRSSLDARDASDAIRIALPDWSRVIDAPRFGDVIVFRIVRAPWHTAIRLNGGEMLHTDEGHGSVIEPVNSLRWRHRYFGAFRWKS